eukprot:SM000136S00173  [mRNA]  locus=s136:184851:188612:- [translate_table: standard]
MVDNVEGRYLLAGCADGSASVYDVIQATRHDGPAGRVRHEELATVDRQRHQGHRFAVSSVAWYPLDTGLFITGSHDQNVNVWDTNALQVEVQFAMPAKVCAVAMSGAAAAAHALVACATEDPRVRLADIASGAFTHTLSGHRAFYVLTAIVGWPHGPDGVWALQWSPASEWVLVSGGADGAVRFWDIRTAGCYLVLDQHRSQAGRRPPPLPRAPSGAAGGVTQQLRLADKRGRQPRLPQPGTGSRPHAAATRSRQHPGASLEASKATAHDGAVTSLQMTGDGLYLLSARPHQKATLYRFQILGDTHYCSAGTDSRVRLWDVTSGQNTLVNYPNTVNRAAKAVRLAVSPDSSYVYHPSGSSIRVYETWTGHLHDILRGHYAPVNACTYHPHDEELYSGSNDRQVLVWAPPSVLDNDDLAPAKRRSGVNLRDEDAWSDDDND